MSHLKVGGIPKPIHRTGSPAEREFVRHARRIRRKEYILMEPSISTSGILIFLATLMVLGGVLFKIMS